MSRLEQEIKKVWDRSAEDYNERVRKQLSDERHVKEAWADLVLSRAPREGRLEILDCGTGPGFFPVALGERGHHVTGIDLSEKMIKEAAENVRAAQIEADLYVMDCQETRFPDESFDMVISRSITWTLSDPPKAYREWKRLLKAGGRLVILDGNFFLHLHDKERMARFTEIEERMKKERGTGAFANCYDSINKDLFMSSRYRPLWDLGYLMEIGFSSVFAVPDIRSFIPDPEHMEEVDRELSDLIPMFLVGAEK